MATEKNFNRNTTKLLTNKEEVYFCSLTSTSADSKEIQGGICCSSHLAVTYGGELLYLRIFSLLSPPRNFVKRELLFPHGLQSGMHIGYRVMNRAITIMCSDRAEWSKSRGTITRLHTWRSIWSLPHSVNTGVKKRPNSPFQFPWSTPILCISLYTSIFLSDRLRRSHIMQYRCDYWKLE